jgi:hypothetical protein
MELNGDSIAITPMGLEKAGLGFRRYPFFYWLPKRLLSLFDSDQCAGVSARAK